MTRPIRTGLLFVLGYALLLGGGPSLIWAQDDSEKSSLTAPAFTLETVDGNQFQLDEHRGNVVVLNFWATWCPPCRREIPDFVKLQRKYGNQGLQFVGVALQPEAEVDAVETFAEQVSINYPVGLDDGTIAQQYGGVRSLPTTFLIGPEGKVRERFAGIASRSRLHAELEDLLEETP